MRRMVEKHLGLEEKELDAEKAFISDLVDKVRLLHLATYSWLHPIGSI